MIPLSLPSPKGREIILKWFRKALSAFPPPMGEGQGEGPAPDIFGFPKGSLDHSSKGQFVVLCSDIQIEPHRHT